MRRLSDEQSLQIASHCARCEPCRLLLLAEVEYISIMQIALNIDTKPGASRQFEESTKTEK